VSKALYIASLLLALSVSLSAQEVLSPAKIQARASRKHLPSLGLPIRTDGRIDAIVRYKEECWEGADSIKAVPRWTMWQMKSDDPALPEHFGTILNLFRKWLGEKPKGTVDIVYGPCKGGWFIAACKKTRTDLGWKSIAFVIPPDGIVDGKRIYDFSHSINWLEHQIGYNLYPGLPAYIQEIIEEMTATELLCPFQEFDPAINNRPEPEVDYDWEADYREI
jgi:hypothetical protein